MTKLLFLLLFVWSRVGAEDDPDWTPPLDYYNDSSSTNDGLGHSGPSATTRGNKSEGFFNPFEAQSSDHDYVEESNDARPINPNGSSAKPPNALRDTVSDVEVLGQGVEQLVSGARNISTDEKPNASIQQYSGDKNSSSVNAPLIERPIGPSNESSSSEGAPLPLSKPSFSNAENQTSVRQQPLRGDQPAVVTDEEDKEYNNSFDLLFSGLSGRQSPLNNVKEEEESENSIATNYSSRADYDNFDVIDSQENKSSLNDSDVIETFKPSYKVDQKPKISVPIPVIMVPKSQNMTPNFLTPDALFNASIPVIVQPESGFEFVPKVNTSQVLPSSGFDSIPIITDRSASSSQNGPLSSLPPRPVSSLGEVSSPFFFLCHYPLKGEQHPSYSRPSPIHQRLDDPHRDVHVRLSVLGDRKLDKGYTPNAGYEMGVTSSVGVDGFLVTGVQALAPHHADVLAAPTPPKGFSSEGRVCTVLHQQSASAPQTQHTFLWVAPAPGSGCVAFLATGSVNGDLVYKDINIFEVCEEETGPAQLRSATTLVSGVRPQPGLVLRDTFDGPELRNDVWSTVVGGQISEVYSPSPGSALLLSTATPSWGETAPLDFSDALDLHFTLTSGSCKEGSIIKLYFGSTDASLDGSIPKENAFRNNQPLELNEGSGFGQEEVSRPQSQMAADASGSDRPRCSHWVFEDEFRVTDDAIEHVVLTPLRHRRPNVCIKFEVQPEPTEATDKTKDFERCLVVDNLALASTTSDAATGLTEDFDSFEPSNWLAFPGGVIERACASETASLHFPEVASGTAAQLRQHQQQLQLRRLATAPLDLSVSPAPHDVIFEHRFSGPLDDEWIVVGGGVGSCGGSRSYPVLIMSGGPVRKFCTPSLDAREVGALHLKAFSGCPHEPQAGRKIMPLSLYAERDSVRLVLDKALLGGAGAAGVEEMISVPVPPSVQKNNTRFCVEQSTLADADESGWAVESLVLLPHLPSSPSKYFQARVNFGCSSLPRSLYGRRPYEAPVLAVLESSTNYGHTWTAVHQPCLPGACEGSVQSLSAVIGPAHEQGWEVVTVPLPYHSLTPHTRLRLSLHPDASGRLSTAAWAVDDIFIGGCEGGCSGRGLCLESGACRCEYGYTGKSCAHSTHERPPFLAEPFTLPVQASANLAEVWGGDGGYQCDVVGGEGAAGVFRGWGERSLYTVDINTTEATVLQFHFFGGTVSQVGKCPGADQPSESVYVHVSCNAGLTWSLLHTLNAGLYHEPSHVSLALPPSARSNSCRFRLSQPQHSGADHDMWAVDDLTVTAQALDYIQLSFQDLESANSSLRFHLGSLGTSCGRDEVLVFPAEPSTAASSFSGQSRPLNKKRLMETKSLAIGPSFMMQFQLMIGCGRDDADHPLDDPEEEAENVVMLEYSLNHGLSWHLVQRPCSPSTPGCRSHFTRGTVYHSTEFHHWKRITLRLPRHTWSPVTRLRLREGTVDADGNPSPDDGLGRRTVEWAIDDLYIGHRCSGHCSGHGQCTSDGCICDENFHGQSCIPVHKLHRSVEADFDDIFKSGSEKDDQVVQIDDLSRYGISVVGGQLVDGNSGCGSVVSGHNLYFGAPGVRQLEVDDMAAGALESIQFHLTVGGAVSVSPFRTRGVAPRQTPSCYVGERPGSDMSEGSVVVQYSTDGGLEWTLLHELVPDLYRSPKLFRHTLPSELINAPSGVVRFRIWQPKHGAGDQWALDHLLILPSWHRGSLIADAASNAHAESPWLTITGHQMLPYCPEMEIAPQNSEKKQQDLTLSPDFNETQELEADAQLLPPGSQEDTVQRPLSFVLNGPELVREAATRPLNLSEGDVIYFMIHLGCASFSADAAASEAAPAEPVYFEYTADGGQTWQLVVPPCPPSALHCTPPTAPSVYRPEGVKGWTQVLVDVDHRLSMGTIELRWRQHNPAGGTTGEFALRGVYAGPACPRHCSGHGVCGGGGECTCYPGYTGKTCEHAPHPRPPFLKASASDSASPQQDASSPWAQVLGGSAVDEGCGPIVRGKKVLLFAGDTPRMAQLVEVDTSFIKTLHFDLQIGSGGRGGSLCREAVAPRDNVLVQASIDGGLHWRTLMEVEPAMTLNRTRPFAVDLPEFARSRQTSIRWWQPDPLSMDPGVSSSSSGTSSSPRANDKAEWQLGWVQLMANDTLPHSLSGTRPVSSQSSASDGQPQQTETWFLIRGGKEKQSLCYNESMIVFGGNTEQFAETWDVEATEATMVQFDLFGPCALDSASVSSHPQALVSQKSAVPSYVTEQMLRDAPYPASPSIAVEYSTDAGTTWSMVREMCTPPDTTCASYDHASVFEVPEENGHVVRAKRRVMIEMPRIFAGNPLRVRLRSVSPTTGGAWGVSNVFLGDACPWMCSGHGYCSEEGECRCDPDYFSDVCVPAVVLPCELLDTFNSPGLPGGAGGRVFVPENSTTDTEVTQGEFASWWWSVRGARQSVECKPLVGGTALVFVGEREREAVTIDMDMTSAQFLQFTIMVGCDPVPRTSARSPTYGDRGRFSGNSFEEQRDKTLGESRGITKGDDFSLSQRDEGILVQYSIDGGISWELLKEIHFAPYSRPRFVNIDLRDFPHAQTNATRFRLWQPNHPAVEGRRSWAVDNLYIGGSPIVPNVLYEDFNGDRPISDAWVDWPGGNIGRLCDSGLDQRKALVFDSLEPAGSGGERALYSRDVSVYGDSVLQFEIKIGCGSGTPSPRNISLQYSTDNGASWTSVRDLARTTDDSYSRPQTSASPRRGRKAEFGARIEMQSDYPQQRYKNSYEHPLYPDYFNGEIVSEKSEVETQSEPGPVQHRVSPDCLHELKAPSVYYWNSAPQWRREVIPLSNLQICGNVRFRWIELGDPSLPSLAWALDNIYMGPACIYHCSGHGLCINGDTCLCDEGYDDEASCLPLSSNPSGLKLSFDDGAAGIQQETPYKVQQQPHELVQRISGGQVSNNCPVIRGSALEFSDTGERSLTTRDLDTSDGSVVQFYLRLGCEPASSRPFSTSSSAVEVQPILLQFSTDGGVSWTLIAELTQDVRASKGAPHTSHFTVPLPDAARTNATQLRWWQPSDDGTFDGVWAIDEIYVGSRSTALATFSPPAEGDWLLTAGAQVKPACGHTSPVLAFDGSSWPQFAESPDLVGAAGTVLQFLATTWCPPHAPSCYGIKVEYSVDFGKNWRDWLPRGPAPPVHNPLVDSPPSWASAFYSSDLFQSQQLITLPLPPLAWSRTMRVRFSVSKTDGSHPPSWALAHVFFGNCAGGCGNRGLCTPTGCSCTPGWTGSTCSHPSTPLPTHLSEEFEGGVRPDNWRLVVGGSVSSVCSAGGAGDAMHFTGSCSRYLETTDLDLEDAHYVQFLIRSSCPGYRPSQYSSEAPKSSSSQLSYTSQLQQQSAPYQQRSSKSMDAIIRTYQEPDLESSTRIYRTRRSVFNPYQAPWTSFEPSYEDSTLVVDEGHRQLNNDSKILVQITCDGGITWSTLKSMSPYHINTSKYVWLEIPDGLHCSIGRVRWWQVPGLSSTDTPQSFPSSPQPDWLLDSIVIGGSRSGPPTTLDAPSAEDFTSPDWIMMYNTGRGRSCNSSEEVLTAKSSFSEPAVAQTSDIKIVGNTSLHFEIAIGCGAAWDKNLPPVRVEFSLDHGYSWALVRATCLPGDSSCLQLDDSSIFYGPLTWTRIVYPLYNVGPAKYVRFRWIQDPTVDQSGAHEWSLRHVYIGMACPYHCLGRGYCMNTVCYCDPQYTGLHCQYLLQDNIPYIRDTFPGPSFKHHWAHVMGGVHSSGCEDVIEEPPAVTFEGRNTRSLTTIPVDTRSAKFVLFTAVIGGRRDRKSSETIVGGRQQQTDLCRAPDSRMHNVFLQYSVDGGITWQLLRELDHSRYSAPHEDYVLIPPNARSSTTLFRFWQPRQSPPAPSWTLDNVFIGGSEIGHAQLIEDFHDEPQVSQWLFAPHSSPSSSYCSSNTSALVWLQQNPGTRAITTQEIIVRHDTLLQFKISIGCEASVDCPSVTPNVLLEYSKDGGATPWNLVSDFCLPSGSQDSDCLPYEYHGPSVYEPDVYQSWTRVTIPLPEKTWSSTTQLRWVQAPSPRPLPWSLSSVSVGASCPDLCHGRGDCLQGRCHCDPGFQGESCEPRPSTTSESLPQTLIDGFEGSLNGSWSRVLGGWSSRSCSSMAPHGSGKHLYFGGCGTRSAVTQMLDTTRTGKVIFVLKIGSPEGPQSCLFDRSASSGNVLDRGVVLQYSTNNGILWRTINVHDPNEYRKARRVVYSLPPDARRYGVQLRWWQPVHSEASDHWAIDNVEIELSSPKDTSPFAVLHGEDGI